MIDRSATRLRAFAPSSRLARAVARPRALVLLALLGAAPRATAQVETRFWSDEHLEGYVEAANSRWNSLYKLEEFAALDGKPLGSATRLAEVRRRWAAERERAAAEIRALEGDPERRFLLQLDERLARHPYFKDRAFDRVDRHAPVHFHVQRAAGAREGLDNWVSNELGPWLAEFDRVFQEEYVGPEGLEAGREHGAVVVAVLPTEGDYRNYANAIADRSLRSSIAHYDFDLEIAVIHTDSSSDPRVHVGRHERRRPVLHEMTHRLQHVWYTGTGEWPRQIWFMEGLAEYLSFHLGHAPESLRDHPVDTEAVKLVTPHAERGSPYVLPLEPLFAASSYGEVLQSMARRAREQRQDFEPGLAMPLFYAHAGLLMHYLHHELGTEHPDVGRRYVAAALRGRGGLGELRKLLGELTVDEVERGFAAWLTASYDGYFDRRFGTAETDGEAAAPAPFDPAALAPAGDDAETAFALAIARGAAGDLDGAEAALAELVARAAEPRSADEAEPREAHSGTAEPAGEATSASVAPSAERIERELERVRGFRALALDFLRAAAETRKRVPLTLAGEPVNARVEAVEADGVVLESVKLGGTRRFALAELDPREIALVMTERKFRFDCGPLCAWPFAAAGAAIPAETRLEGPGAAELHADAERDYPDHVLTARTARRLEALAAAGAPADPGGAEAMLAAVRELLADAALHRLVTERRVALRALAVLALEQRFETVGIGGVLQGRFEELEDRRVRLVYDFEDEAQLADWIAEDYADGPRFANATEVAAGRFWVASGSLVGNGAAFVRHALPLDAPFAARFSLTVPNPADLPDIWIGCCDDRAGACVIASIFGALVDVAPRRPASYADDVVSPPSPSYELELRHDGSRLSSTVGGRPAARVGTRQSGGDVFLWSTGTAALEIRELVLEGVLPPRGHAALRERWIAAELAALGLGE